MEIKDIIKEKMSGDFTWIIFNKKSISSFCYPKMSNARNRYK